MEDKGGYCNVEGACVHDGNDDYGAKEECTFRYVGPPTNLVREEWHVEQLYNDCRMDYLQVDNQRYCGTPASVRSFPANMPISHDIVSDFKWISDVNYEYAGFKLCAREALPRVCHRHNASAQHNNRHSVGPNAAVQLNHRATVQNVHGHRRQLHGGLRQGPARYMWGRGVWGGRLRRHRHGVLQR